MAEDTANRPCRSFFRHAGLAQAGEVSGFDQSADLRYAPIFDSPEASNARKAIVAEQPPGFGEFRGGKVGLSFKAIGRGEERVICGGSGFLDSPYLLRGRTIDQPNQSLPSRKRGCGQLT